MQESMVIPHREIRELEDRSWSLFLVKEIELAVPDADLSDIYETLEALDDPRAIEPLVSLLENDSLPDYIRKAASSALRHCTSAETSSKRRQWWSSGDEILMGHAIRMARRTESDLLEEIAGQPDHNFYMDAIARLSRRFDEPRFQQYKIKALAHPHAGVREIAADSLEWDQPVEAEEPLLQAIHDSNDDVAKMALLTLKYYASQKVLLSIHDMLSSASALRVKAFVKCFVYLKGAFLDELKSLDSFALPFFRAWIEPVSEILELNDSSKPEAPLKRAATHMRWEQKREPRYTLPELFAFLSDPNGLWKEKKDLLHELNQQHLSDAERGIASSLIADHQDHTVRSYACRILAKWDQSGQLMQLLDDPVYAVRKAASYWLREVSCNHLIADRLFDLLNDIETSSTHAQETLESYVVHADETGLNDRLVTLALNDQRESVRSAAINELRKRKAVDEIQSIIPLLERDPLVSWTVHTSLLDACNRLNITIPDLDHLKKIDDLYVQVSLARLQGHKFSP